MTRDILICTVGTSLLGHHAEITGKDPGKLVTTLSGLDPTSRLCGAEVNSITSILQKGYLADRTRLVLLVSDTEDGALLGEVLRRYYLDRANTWRFREAESISMVGLTDTDIRRFRSEGLRNLVREVAKNARQFGSNRLVINATGGYKAQISFAGMIGQALDIPVCYLFERFSEVIELPPQPIALDLTFWLEYVDLFFQLAVDDADRNPAEKEPRFSSLVDEEKVDGRTIIGLSAMGQLFHESLCYRFAQQREALLPPPSNLEPSQKEIKYEDKNSNKHKGLSEWLESICERPYVKRIYTHYYNPNLPRKICFRPSTTGKIDQVEGWYSDGKATTKFDLVTTASKEMQQKAVIADLIGMIP